MDARVDRFTLAGARFVDAGVWTTISGSGGISATKDLMFRIEGGKLIPAATLETGGYAHGGASFLHQITSELLVGKDELVRVKRDRLARGRIPPLTVHCKVSRTLYKIIDGRLERSGEIDASELERLRPRLRRSHASIPGRSFLAAQDVQLRTDAGLFSVNGTGVRSEV